MHGFWIFWIVALVFWASSMRRRHRWGRQWVMVGPGWYPAHVLRDGTEPASSARGARTVPSRTRDERDAEVEALESRIAELEQRLDFTERLLADRHRGTSPPPA